MLKTPSESERYFTNCFSLIDVNQASSTISESFLLKVVSKLSCLRN